MISTLLQILHLIRAFLPLLSAAALAIDFCDTIALSRLSTGAFTLGGVHGVHATI